MSLFRLYDRLECADPKSASLLSSLNALSKNCMLVSIGLTSNVFRIDLGVLCKVSC